MHIFIGENSEYVGIGEYKGVGKEGQTLSLDASEVLLIFIG
jgi:hypothetical protein